MNNNKNLTINEIFNLAIKNHQEGKTDIALEFYNKVLKINPNHSQALNNLGVIFQNQMNHEKAKEYYEKALEINLNYSDAHYNLGNIFKDLGENQKAIGCYQKVIEINPDYADALNSLGNIFKELKNYQKAKECYEKVIQIDPNYADAYKNLQIIFFQLKEFKNSYNNHIKFLQLKSNGIISNAKLENVIPKFAKKLQHQDYIPTFFDNAVHNHLTQKKNPIFDFCEVFERGQLSKYNRFVSYSKRINDVSKLTHANILHNGGLPFLSSQGVHSLIKWKEKPLYKTAFDLVIYSMLIQEVKPDIIIELGSGCGGSAMWFADTASMLGLDTHVYSFDINKPLVKHDKVTFIEHDLKKINLENKPSHWEFFNKKKIIIEDAHVNLRGLLNLFDHVLKKDDYLMIEDSANKQDIISHFSIEKDPKYKLDQFFLDFFGTNMTCCINSIFKCH
jgi:tetratricopeptide (TPR) repeat protein